jgi:predicted permease
VFVANLRYALRQFRNAPGFVFIAVVSLSLGIGANSAIFSVVNAVLRNPAGVDHPARVAALATRYTQYALDTPLLSVPDFADVLSLKNQVETAALQSDIGFNITEGGQAQHLAGSQVTWQWFRVFGAQPYLGRTFTASEDQPGGSAVAVISYRLWQQDFGSQPDIIGRTLLLDAQPYRIIGVMRGDFDWPRGKEIWTPLALPANAYAAGNRFNENYHAMARLRPGVTLGQLNAGLAMKRQEELHREGNNPYAVSSGWSMYATPLTDFAAGPLRRPLFVLMGVVCLVLLIASANVAGLLLARASARSRELAIRIALGASAKSVLAQTFIETLVLAGVATLIGIAAGPAFGAALLWMVPPKVAEGFTIHTEPVILAFTALVGLLASLFAGVGPALKTIHDRNRLQLHGGVRGATVSAEKQRLRSAFVIGEVALAFVLLTGTGLFLLSLRQLQQVNPGFNPHGVLAAQVDYSGEDFKSNQQRQANFVSSVVANLASQPGVRSAAAVEPLPFSGRNNSSSFAIEGRPTGPNDPGPHGHITYATPNYLAVMQIKLLAGRWFTADDRVNTVPVTVIDQRLAQKYWPNRSPIGEHLRSGRNNAWVTIIGVVSNIRSDSLETDTTDGMRYYPFEQARSVTANFLVRADGNPAHLSSAMKNAISSTDRNQTAYDIEPIDTLVSNSLSGRRLIVWMLAAFAALALVLALVGIYGLISYITVQRTKEVGIRIALGAQTKNVLWLVLKNVMQWVILGSCIGVALSVTFTTFLQHFFTDFGGSIALISVLAALAMLLVGIGAGLIPASRAASTNPLTALREE